MYNPGIRQGMIGHLLRWRARSFPNIPLEQALQLESCHIKALLRKARAARIAEDIETARAALDTLLKEEPQNVLAKKEVQLVNELERRQMTSFKNAMQGLFQS